MDFDYTAFNEFEFIPRRPDHVGEVYILIFKLGDTEVPFYVGQTTRFHGRMDDYFWADFQAATDFKVGVAIQYLCQTLTGSVLVRHKLVPDLPAAEKEIIKDFTALGMPLSNGFAYDYKTAALEDVTRQIHIKCHQIARLAEPERPTELH
jgi:hypothetical protein